MERPVADDSHDGARSSTFHPGGSARRQRGFDKIDAKMTARAVETALTRILRKIIGIFFTLTARQPPPGGVVFRINSLMLMRRLKIVLILWPGLLAGVCLQAVTVSQLRCEDLDNPQGIDAAQPRLSWRLNSDERDQRQPSPTVASSTSTTITSPLLERLSPERRRQDHEAQAQRVHPPLPSSHAAQRFHRIRSFGFLANSHRAAKLALCRSLLADRDELTAPENADPSSVNSSHRTNADPPVCPDCGGVMRIIGRAPPAFDQTRSRSSSFWCDTS